MNPIPPTIEVNTRAKALAVRTDPLRTKARGTKGAFDRDSMNRKSPRTRTDAARGMKVHSDAKPTPAALVSPKTSRMIPEYPDAGFSASRHLPVSISGREAPQRSRSAH